MRAASRCGMTAWEVTSGRYQVNWSSASHVSCPSSTAIAARTTSRTINLGFHCNIREPPQRDTDRAILSRWQWAGIPRPGDLPDYRLRSGKIGFGQGAPRPRETLLIPAGELCDGDAVARRVNEPAVAQVDPGVVDLARL